MHKMSFYSSSDTQIYFVMFALRAPRAATKENTWMFF